MPTLKNKKFFLTLVGIIFLPTFLVYAKDELRPTLPKAPYVSPQEVKFWKKDGREFTLVDVRDPREYASGHLENAINIPYNEVEPRIDEFNKNKTYVFYCIYSSWRAPYAANVLADHGFNTEYILEGGIAAWNAGGQVIYALDPQLKASVAPYPEGLEKVLHHSNDKVYLEKINLTKAELAFYDGKEGRPAYVAVNGVIYDVTQSRLWRGGEHDPSHGKAMAGRDLTELLKDSPHGDKHLKDFTVVGNLITD